MGSVADDGLLTTDYVSCAVPSQADVQWALVEDDSGVTDIRKLASILQAITDPMQSSVKFDQLGLCHYTGTERPPGRSNGSKSLSSNVKLNGQSFLATTGSAHRRTRHHDPDLPKDKSGICGYGSADPFSYEPHYLPVPSVEDLLVEHGWYDEPGSFTMEPSREPIFKSREVKRRGVVGSSSSPDGSPFRPKKLSKTGQENYFTFVVPQRLSAD